MKRRQKPGAVKRRIGIFAGAFDPVHVGHVAFALQALEQAGLDEVVFLPERRPRLQADRPEAEHYAHRVAMIRRALRPYRRLRVIETTGKNFTVARTLPMLQSVFTGDTLVMLVGSDVALTMPDWQHAGRLLAATETVIGVRSEHSIADIEAHAQAWQPAPHGLIVLPSYASDVTSSRVREALRRGTHADGILDSVRRYARREWLYVWPEFARQRAS